MRKLTTDEEKMKKKTSMKRQKIDRGVPLKYQIKNMKKTNSQIFSAFRRKEHLCVAGFSFFRTQKESNRPISFDV